MNHEEALIYAAQITAGIAVWVTAVVLAGNWFGPPGFFAALFLPPIFFLAYLALRLW